MKSWRSIPAWLAAAVLLGVLMAVPAAAQSSASYEIQDASLNSGGDPRVAVVLGSPHFHISVDSIGDGVVRSGLTSTSFHMDSGFVSRHPPRPEVTGLRLALLVSPNTQLQWDPLPSASTYQVYRGALSDLPGTYGTCFASGLTSTSTTDASVPALGQGFFYIATARNALGEEGPKGFQSTGLEQANPQPCP